MDDAYARARRHHYCAQAPMRGEPRRQAGIAAVAALMWFLVFPWVGVMTERGPSVADFAATIRSSQSTDNANASKEAGR